MQTTVKGARMDTRHEAEGAEFLVLGHLLIEKIIAHKTYTRIPGYDLTAINPETHKSARIQVKSRWATDFDGGFICKNFDCDFFVLVALNRGHRYSKKKDLQGKHEPDFHVFPVDVVASASKLTSSKWGKVLKRKIPNVEEYRNRWDLIRDYLACGR